MSSDLSNDTTSANVEPIVNPAEEFAERIIVEKIKKGQLKAYVKKTERQLGIETVNGGRYIRAFTKLQNLDCYEKMVILNLASRLDFRGLDENGLFNDEVRFVTQESLAEDLGISERKLRDVLNSLVQKGFIQKFGSYNFKLKRKNVNSYSITEYAFICAYQTLKSQDELKYASYLEEISELRKQYIEMFKESSRLQAIHELPAQSAGSENQENNQPARCAGSSGTACRLDQHSVPVAPAHCADIVLETVPTVSPVISPADDQKTNNSKIEEKENLRLDKENNKGSFLQDFISNEPRKEKNPKPKAWKVKSEDEKKDSILNMACSSHRVAVKKRKNVYPYPFCDFPDLLGPVIEKFGLDEIRSFYRSEIVRSFGSNILTIEKEITLWLADKSNNTNKNPEKNESKEENLTTIHKNQTQFKINKQDTQIKPNFKDLKKEQLDKDFSKLPLNFINWFNSCDERNKNLIRKDLMQNGYDTFLTQIQGMVGYQRYIQSLRTSHIFTNEVAHNAS